MQGTKSSVDGRVLEMRHTVDDEGRDPNVYTSLSVQLNVALEEIQCEWLLPPMMMSANHVGAKRERKKAKNLEMAKLRVRTANAGSARPSPLQSQTRPSDLRYVRKLRLSKDLRNVHSDRTVQIF